MTSKQQNVERNLGFFFYKSSISETDRKEMRAKYHAKNTFHYKLLKKSNLLYIKLSYFSKTPPFNHFFNIITVTLGDVLSIFYTLSGLLLKVSLENMTLQNGVNSKWKNLLPEEKILFFKRDYLHWEEHQKS